MYQTLAVSPRNPWICAVLLLIDESGGGTAIQPIGKTPLLIVLRKPRAAIHAQAPAAFNGLFTLFPKSRFEDRKPHSFIKRALARDSGHFCSSWDSELSMKSGGPWNLRGLLPEVREAARAAARQSGLSVGEWLNGVIEAVDEQEGEFAPSTGLDRFSDDGSRQSVRSDDRWHHDADWDDREANAQRRQNFRAENPQQDRRYHDADWDDREAHAQRRQHFRAEHPQQDRRYHDADWDDREAHAQRRQNFRAKEPEQESRYDRDWNEREANAQRRQNFRAENPQQDRRYHDADWDDREAHAQRRRHFRAEHPQQDRRCHDADWDEREAHAQQRQHFRAKEREQESRYRDRDRSEREANGQSRQNFRAKERQNDRSYLDAHWRDHSSMEEAAHRHYRQAGCVRTRRVR
jgi:hypothetical protein